MSADLDVSDWVKPDSMVGMTHKCCIDDTML